MGGLCISPQIFLRLALIALAALVASAQEVTQLADLNLAELAEIPIVSAARHEQNRLGSPRSVSVITGEEIRRRNFRNVPEAVATMTGVYMQQSNYGGGSPIIRGMIGNRILLMVNGIRLNNATYRLGPNQYLNLIDINQVERIEVVRGAGSVLYGSDAMGGVINVITKSAPDPSQGSELAGFARVRFASSDSSGAGHIQASGAQGHVGFLGGYTREQFGDLRAGSGRGVQKFTGYKESAGDLTLRFALGSKGSLVAGVSRLVQNEVPRTDLLAAGSDLEYLWQPQGRDLFYTQYTDNAVSHYIDAIQITFSYQRPFEYIQRIVASDPMTERHHRDSVHSVEAGLQLTSALGKFHVFTYGFTTTADRVMSTRIDTSLLTGASIPKPGNYPDGSRFSGAAFFVQDEVGLSKRLDAVVGVRYDRFQLHADLFDPATGNMTVRGAPAALTGNGHLLYKLTGHVSATAGVSQGFRAPNVDDSTILAGVGSRFEIPNVNLQPERSINVEYGLRAQGHRGSLSVVVFQGRYEDLIDRAPALLNGLPFLDLNGNGIKDVKEQDIFQRQNVSRAAVSGFELEALVSIADDWTWSHNTTWTRGTDLSLGQPLTRIPPLNGASRLTWQPRRCFWVEAAIVAATAQHRLAPADKTDIRIGPGGTAGYAVFHLRAGLSRSALAGLSVTLENVTNRRYRLHASGIDRPGINLVVGYARAF